MTIHRLSLKYGQMNPESIDIIMFYSLVQVVKESRERTSEKLSVAHMVNDASLAAQWIAAHLPIYRMRHGRQVRV